MLVGPFFDPPTHPTNHTTTHHRLEQSQRVADGATAEAKEKIEELQRQLGREQAALKGREG